MSIMKAVRPEDVPNMRDGRRGRGSFAIMKEFMETINPETGNPVTVVVLDHVALGKISQTLSTTLTMYSKAHDLPVKVMQRNGNVYLIRKDLLEDGTPDPDYEGRIVDPAQIKSMSDATEEAE